MPPAAGFALRVVQAPQAIQINRICAARVRDSFQGANDKERQGCACGFDVTISEIRSSPHIAVL